MKRINTHAGSITGHCLVLHSVPFDGIFYLAIVKPRGLAWKLYCNDIILEWDGKRRGGTLHFKGQKIFAPIWPATQSNVIEEAFRIAELAEKEYETKKKTT